VRYYLTENLTLPDVREKAREKLKGICGVYRNCDGLDTRLCQGHSYGRPLGIGGVGSGSSFHNNFLALKKLQLKMKVIGPHFEPDTKFFFFDRELSMPVMGASVAGVNSFGGEKVITEKEFCRSVVFGCKEAATVGWRGDSYTYSLENTWGIDAIAEANGWGVKIVKPRDQEVIIEFFKKAEAAGAIAVGTDVDGCGSYAMAKYDKPIYRKSVEDLKELVKSTSLPVIIKGIMFVEDALAAVEAGASAIVVSNHGGRVLDHTPGTADVLPNIVAELKGKVTILADGGIRNGYDVLKMLALGADAVLIGRDIVRAAVGAGILGVRLQMEYFQRTLAKAMKMTGIKSLAEITSDILI
jgi:isopentenyl diphosphate isomerase/L-lactate dehydrogenase-like FMN-dependent dehydrogenase